MSSTKALVLKSYVGKGNTPNKSHFEVVDWPLAELTDGGVRARTLYLSVDPYMRGRMNTEKSYVPPFVEKEPLNGSGIGVVTESKNEAYKIGDLVVTMKNLIWPFQQEVVFDKVQLQLYSKLDSEVPKNLLSTTVGYLGMPGLTAYFGFLQRGKPQAGETVVVSGAAGAVGSVVGQLAKMKGCHVVGIAGTQEKSDLITSELGFDSAVIYKGKSAAQISEEIKQLCPNGVDIYFDNVGGEISEGILLQMNKNGRVPICGQISQYNVNHKDHSAMTDVPANIAKHLQDNNVHREWFMVFQFQDQYEAAWKELFQWVQEGKVKVKETLYEGIEEIPNAFLGLFQGDNIGKVVIKLSDL